MARANYGSGENPRRSKWERKKKHKTPLTTKPSLSYTISPPALRYTLELL